MNYHIAIQDGIKIASFVHEHDRDICIDALRELYPDVADDYFNAVNDEGD